MRGGVKTKGKPSGINILHTKRRIKQKTDFLSPKLNHATQLKCEFLQKDIEKNNLKAVKKILNDNRENEKFQDSMAIKMLVRSLARHLLEERKISRSEAFVTKTAWLILEDLKEREFDSLNKYFPEATLLKENYDDLEQDLKHTLMERGEQEIDDFISNKKKSLWLQNLIRVWESQEGQETDTTSYRLMEYASSKTFYSMHRGLSPWEDYLYSRRGNTKGLNQYINLYYQRVYKRHDPKEIQKLQKRCKEKLIDNLQKFIKEDPQNALEKLLNKSQEIVGQVLFEYSKGRGYDASIAHNVLAVSPYTPQRGEPIGLGGLRLQVKELQNIPIKIYEEALKAWHNKGKGSQTVNPEQQASLVFFKKLHSKNLNRYK